MNHAFLIQAHAYPELLFKIVNELNASNHFFFIHIDKKGKDMLSSSCIRELKLYQNVILLSDYQVNWGGASQFKVTVRLLFEALLYIPKMDYFHLISGQDFPLKSNKEFDSFFEKHDWAGYMGFADIKHMDERFSVFHFNDLIDVRTRSLCGKITKWIFSLLLSCELRFYRLGFNFRPSLKYTLYKGSSWWSLRRDCASYIDSFLKEHPDFLRRFLWTNCCDEIFFHIIVMNSPYKNQIFPNNLRYIDWTDKGRGSLPLTLIKDDFEQILAKDDCFFCRKIQPHVSDELIAMILNYKNGK